MREIKFRGIDTITGNWVYGTYLKHQTYMPYPIGVGHSKEEDYVHLILTSGFADWGMKRGIDCHTVLKESVGQYTGLKDKNGKEIYEGDILRVWDEYHEKWVEDEYGLVEFNEDRFRIPSNFGADYTNWGKYEVIGNIYENKELEELQYE